jgi:hypothetical protein
MASTRERERVVGCKKREGQKRKKERKKKQNKKNKTKKQKAYC